MARRFARKGVSSLTRMRAMPKRRVGRNTFRTFSGRNNNHTVFKRPNFLDNRPKTVAQRKKRSARRRGNLRR